MTDELSTVVEPMRAYAFAHPLNRPDESERVGLRTNPLGIALRPIERYANDIIVADFPVRLQFSYLVLRQATVAQLSFSNLLGGDLPKEVIERIVCAFFRQGDNIAFLSRKGREGIYGALGLETGVSGNTYQFLARNPRMTPGAAPLSVDVLRVAMRTI